MKCKLPCRVIGNPADSESVMYWFESSQGNNMEAEGGKGVSRLFGKQEPIKIGRASCRERV